MNGKDHIFHVELQQMKNSQTRFFSNFQKTFNLMLENVRPKQISLTKGRKFRVGGKTASAGECTVHSANNILTPLLTPK